MAPPPTEFQPRPPLRTTTTCSEKSQSSLGPASPTYGGTVLPASPTSFNGGMSATSSPVEATFFGAIAQRLRGRSRSRSRNRVSRSRSKSPMTLPPEQLPSPASSSRPTTSTPASHMPTQYVRHASAASQSSMSSMAPQSPRSSMQNAHRRSTASSDPWRGRHSNSWLFNDFSFTGAAKDVIHHCGKGSRS